MSVYKSKWKCVFCGEDEIARWNPEIDKFEIECKCGKTTAKELTLGSWELIG